MNYVASSFRRVGRWVLFCAFASAVLLPSVSWAITASLVETAAGGGSYTLVVYTLPAGGGSLQAPTSSPGSAGTYPTAFTWTITAQSYQLYCSGVGQGLTAGDPAGHTFSMDGGTCTGYSDTAPGSTNGYSFVHILWTNTMTVGTGFDWGLNATNADPSQTGMSGDVRWVWPNGIVDEWITNRGAGGTFVWGVTKERPGSPPDGSGVGTWVPDNTSPTVPKTGVGPPTTGVFTNLTVTTTAGGGTGGASQGDLFKVGAAIVDAVANVEKAVREGGTNGGTGTNSFDDWSITVTNVYDVGVSNKAVADWLYMSNLFASGELMTAYSNDLALWTGSSDLLAINERVEDGSDGITALMEGLGGWFSAPAPDSEWGLVHVTESYDLDLKRALSLEVINDKISGFTAWVKLLIMWGALIFAIRTFVEELRFAVWQTLSINPTPNLGMQILSSLGAVGGPIGWAAGTGAGHFVKAGTTLAIFVAVLFFPAVIVVFVESLFLDLGLSSGWFVAQVGNVLSAPTVVTQVLGLTSNWMPWVPLLTIALNYLLMRLAIDTVASAACVWLKLAVPA